MLRVLYSVVVSGVYCEMYVYSYKYNPQIRTYCSAIAKVCTLERIFTIVLALIVDIVLISILTPLD